MRTKNTIWADNRRVTPLHPGPSRVFSWSFFGNKWSNPAILVAFNATRWGCGRFLLHAAIHSALVESISWHYERRLVSVFRATDSARPHTVSRLLHVCTAGAVAPDGRARADFRGSCRGARVVWLCGLDSSGSGSICLAEPVISGFLGHAGSDLHSYNLL